MGDDYGGEGKRKGQMTGGGKGFGEGGGRGVCIFLSVFLVRKVRLE